MDGRERRVPFTCTLDCGSRCELTAVVRDGEIVRIDTPAQREDSVQFPRLVPCARGRAHRRLQTAEDRVLYPMRRNGPRGSGQFERVSWDQALDEIATNMIKARARYGAQTIMHATGAGAIAGRGLNGADASRRFFSGWDSVTATVGNQSNHCASVASHWMFGESISGSDRANLLDSRLIILWGMNPAELRMAPNTEYFVGQARDRGARVVLVDPRYTDSGILSDEWIPIRPGTDAAMVAAMAYVMETEGLVDQEFMDRCTQGYLPYQRYVLGDDDGTPKTPAWAAAITGVSADRIVSLAREYATQRPAALLAGWGPQRAANGEQIMRALITLSCMSGNVGIPGGEIAAGGTRRGSVTIGSLPMGSRAPLRTLSNTSWSETVLAGQLDPPITMAYIVATNLVNRSANTNANIRALATMDCVVVHDPFMTPTALHADYVLPICSELEREDIVASWGHDSHLFSSGKAAEPAGESRTDYWILSQLAERLGFGDAYTQGRDEHGWLDYLLAASAVDAETFGREGMVRTDPSPRVALAGFRDDPTLHPMRTQSGLIEIENPEAILYGLPGIPSYVPPDRDDQECAYPLHLLTPHHRLRANSCLAANPWLQGLERHAVWISTADAAERAILPWDVVEVFNHHGSVRMPAYVTGRIMPGVVCVYQGTWHRPAKDGVDEGGCANVLTSHRLTPTGGPTTHTNWVDIRKVAP